MPLVCLIVNVKGLKFAGCLNASNAHPFIFREDMEIKVIPLRTKLIYELVVDDYDFMSSGYRKP